jgi:hypothetical protein
LSKFPCREKHLKFNQISLKTIYKKIQLPNKTAIGICLSKDDAKIENPTIKDTKKPESLCSLMSIIFGESPGA